MNAVPDQFQSSIAAAVARIALVAAFLLTMLPHPVSEQLAEGWADAETAAERGDSDAAQRALERVLAVSDHSMRKRVYTVLVDMNLAAGRYDAARVYLYALADADGWTPVRRAQLRTIFDRNGEVDRATALLMAELNGQSSASIDLTSDPVTLRELAGHEIEQLQWAKAEATLAALVVVAPDDAWAFYQLGLIVAPQNPEYAADYFIRAAQDAAYTARANAVRTVLGVYTMQSLATAHTTLGMTLVGLGEWPFADRVLQMALDTNAVNPTALAYLGFVHDQQGRDGLPDIEAARAMAPNDPVVYYMLGMHWRLAGQHQTAFEAFEHAYRLDPENPALAAEVGIAWQQLSEFALAEEWLLRAIDLAPDDVLWQVRLAAFYADTGFHLALIGLPYIQAVTERVPNDPGVRASLAWAYAQADELARAYDEIVVAIGLEPANPRTRYYFGAILELHGDVESAVDSYWFVADVSGAERGFGLLAARALQRLDYSAP